MCHASTYAIRMGENVHGTTDDRNTPEHTSMRANTTHRNARRLQHVGWLVVCGGVCNLAATTQHAARVAAVGKDEVAGCDEDGRERRPCRWRTQAGREGMHTVRVDRHACLFTRSWLARGVLQ